MEIEEYAKQLDEEIVELKDEHSKLASNLQILLKTCNDVITEAKQEGDKIIISNKTFSQLQRNTEQIRKYFQNEE